MSGLQINRINWTKDRIRAYRRYLKGDKEATFRGVRSDGTPYKKSIRVGTQIDRYSHVLKFSVKNEQVWVADETYGNRRILTDEQVHKMAQRLYKNKAIGVGKAPSIYNFMKRKYVNVGFKKIERAIKALDSYQMYEARHVAKPKHRAIIVSSGPGRQIDADTMFFSKKYFAKSQNEGYDALTVLVDRFSGYIGIEPLAAPSSKNEFQVGTHGAEPTARNIIRIFKTGFPRAKNGYLFTDGGSEFKSVFPSEMKRMNYRHTIISTAAGAPSAHAERAVGIIRKLINQKLTADGTRPRKKSQSWWPMARDLVRDYNNKPMTDARRPRTPNELKTYTGAKAKEIVRLMTEAGEKRIGAAGRVVDGNRVSKVLEVLRVGAKVRHAVTHVRKTGANKRSHPEQRWSGTVHTVTKVGARKVGFARYKISGMPKRWFEREDLQLVGNLPAARQQDVVGV